MKLMKKILVKMSLSLFYLYNNNTAIILLYLGLTSRWEEKKKNSQFSLTCSKLTYFTFRNVLAKPSLEMSDRVFP
jgi:hypothetical protein